MEEDKKTQQEIDIFYMNKAIELAKQAEEINEVPVGCLIVHDGRIIGTGYNRREIDKNPLSHAEIIAINEAAKTLGGWRLLECNLYVTLEPCFMCAGAIINARIRRVVYGCPDYKSGCFDSKMNINNFNFNHKPEVVGGVLAENCLDMFQGFFRNLRNKK